MKLLLAACGLVLVWLVVSGRATWEETGAAVLATAVGLFAGAMASRRGLGPVRLHAPLLRRLYRAPWLILQEGWLVLTSDGRGSFLRIPAPPGGPAGLATATWLLGVTPNSYVVEEGEDLLIHQYVESANPLDSWQ